jgi:hypothetical protein
MPPDQEDDQIVDEPSLRDSLADAFDSAPDEGGDAQPAPAPASAAAESDAEDAGRVRDGLGRFVSKDGAAEGTGKPAEGQQAPAALAPAPSPEGTAEAPAAPVKPPASWTPVAREHWSNLPAPVQAEVARREHQIQQTLNETQNERQMAAAFRRTVEPYLDIMRMEGASDPFAAIANTFDVVRTLRMGTPTEKAQRVAQLVSVYGVDVAALDSALAGVPMPQQAQGGVDPTMVQSLVQQQLQPLMQAAQQRRMMQVQQVEQEISQDIQKFMADPKNEFFADVREMMADAIDIAEKQGRTLTLADAYDQACYLHPEVRKVILERQQSAGVKTRHQAAQRARAAAVSVRGAAPVGNPNVAEPSSTRDAIEAAIEAHSRV